MWAGKHFGHFFLTKISVHTLQFFDTASLFKGTLQQSRSFITLPAGIRKESIPALLIPTHSPDLSSFSVVVIGK